MTDPRRRRRVRALAGPAAALALLPLLAPGRTAAQSAPVQQVVITGAKSAPEPPLSARSDAELLRRKAGAQGDTARLLRDLPGVSLGGAGAVSSLPALNGLGGDRVRTQVDGLDLVAACPNHMNTPLSYMDPAQVGTVRVYAGISPVSVGGDSLGGTIQVDAAEPVFAEPGDWRVSGRLSGFARGNGNARGGNASASAANDLFSLGYVGATHRRDNFRAARDFKPATPGTEGGRVIPGDEVGSTAYEARNDEVSLAWRQGRHLWQFKVGHQDLGFEGFPNQRMDMTANRSTQLNLRYAGRFDWGELLARAYQQKVDHKMDMGPDRYTYGFGMPMDTEATTRGGKLQATVRLGEADTLRAGAEAQTYVLYDWWPAVGGTMGPNAFWNVDFGRRHKAGAFVEWDRVHDARWFTQFGLRTDRVMTDAAAVQGYDNGLGAIWGNEAAAFNRLQRQRRDTLFDVAALARFTPETGRSIEMGLARKSRAPNLYQRYPWSTQPMAALMNNFLGDGNGYIGNPDLKPEVAHTAALSAQWLDTEREDWSLKATATLTRVNGYIDARRCDFGQCSADNVSATQGFVLLQYVNQQAQVQSLELSGQRHLLQSERLGSFTGSLVLKFTRGRNLRTGAPLYNIMPINATLAVEQRAGDWNAAVELQAVGAKRRVSAVRNEMRTAGHALLNLRAGHDWQRVRVEAGVDNALNRLYTPPLAGAYLGQGRSMTSAGIPWGTTVPGPGRSLHLTVSATY